MAIILDTKGPPCCDYHTWIFIVQMANGKCWFSSASSLYSDYVLQPWFYRYITHHTNGLFCMQMANFATLVLIMLNAQFEKVTAAVQVYEGIHGICWYSSASLCLKTKLVPTSPHVSLPKIISLKRREALNSGWL